MRICPYVTPREPDSDGAMVTSARSAGGSSISEAVPQDAKSDTTLDCKSTIHHPMSIGTRYSMSRARAGGGNRAGNRVSNSGHDVDCRTVDEQVGLAERVDHVALPLVVARDAA